MRTKKETTHYIGMLNTPVKIPKGTKVIPANNLPQPNDSEIAYWAESWRGMTEQAKSHMRTYGFGLRKQDVTE